MCKFNLTVRNHSDKTKLRGKWNQAVFFKTRVIVIVIKDKEKLRTTLSKVLSNSITCYKEIFHERKSQCGKLNFKKSYFVKLPQAT